LRNGRLKPRFSEHSFLSEALQIQRVELTLPAGLELIGALNIELQQRYPEPGATHFRLDPDEVSPGRGAFLVAFLGGDPIGCGAVRLLNAFDAEIKRMYVKPGARRRGVAKALLAALEAEAVDLGAERLLLETGVRQQEAIGLYGGAGFTGIEPFGEYVDSPLSICMAKELAG
jgi:putative acetyltransferase